jgi:hypothetical protein
MRIGGALTPHYAGDSKTNLCEVIGYQRSGSQIGGKKKNKYSTASATTTRTITADGWNRRADANVSEQRYGLAWL